MVRHLISLALLVGGGIAPAVAQHGGAVSDEGCTFCHGSHADGPGAYNLKTVDVSVWVRSGDSGPLSAVSRSCLRCHVSASLRERQPEISLHVTGVAGGGRYLGFDLSRHHPLGRVDLAFSDPSSRSAGRVRRPALVDLWGDEQVECTDCHDPHSRAGSLPAHHEETGLCARCHDPDVYQLGHESLACSDCHQLHRSTQRRLLQEGTPDLLCRSCHDSARASSRVVPVPALLLPAAHAATVQENASSHCETCHDIHR